MDERRSTGIGHLDRELGGGLAAGSLVALRTPPESQGELLLRELASVHDTLYLSTTRTDRAVREWLSADQRGTAGVDIEFTGTDGLLARNGGSVNQRLADAAGWSPGLVEEDRPGVQADAIAATVTAYTGECIVVDPVNPLEAAEESAYMTFLHRLRDHLTSTTAIAFLHIVETPTKPDQRWLTLQMADEVWEISVDTSRERVEFRLTVTKSRSGRVPEEQIKLELGDDVNIDTSRDIA